MGYRCRKCAIVCVNKVVRNYHEAYCNDTVWGEMRRSMSLYDHNYIINAVMPDMRRIWLSNSHYIHDVEHNNYYSTSNPRDEVQRGEHNYNVTPDDGVGSRYRTH